jgi:hypothetical protein
MKQSQGSDDQELFEAVMKYVNNNFEQNEKKDIDPNSIIDFERLSTLIEAF